MIDIDEAIEEIIDTDKHFNPINYEVPDRNYFYNNVFQCTTCSLWKYMDEESEELEVCIHCIGGTTECR